MVYSPQIENPACQGGTLRETEVGFARQVQCNAEGTALSISLHVEAKDPDLENLLLYVDGLTHLNAFSKRNLVERCLAWIIRADLFAYNDQAVSSANLQIDGACLFRPANKCTDHARIQEKVLASGTLQPLS